MIDAKDCAHEAALQFAPVYRHGKLLGPNAAYVERNAPEFYSLGLNDRQIGRELFPGHDSNWSRQLVFRWRKYHKKPENAGNGSPRKKGTITMKQKPTMLHITVEGQTLLRVGDNGCTGEQTFTPEQEQTIDRLLDEARKYLELRRNPQTPKEKA